MTDKHSPSADETLNNQTEVSPENENEEISLDEVDKVAGGTTFIPSSV